MYEENWKIPFNIALGLHIAFFIAIIYLPGVLKNKPEFEEIYTFDLVSVAAPLQQQSPPEQRQQEKKPAPEKQPEVKQPAPVPPPKPEAVAIPDKPAPTPAVKQPEPAPQPAVEAKPVSLSASKRKIKKTVPPPEDTTAAAKKRIRQEALQRQKRADELARKAQQEADLAAREAEEAARQLKDMLRQQQTVQTSAPANQNTRQSSRPTQNRQSSIIEQQYFAEIHNRLSYYWRPPDTQTWSQDLKATVVISISQNGSVTNTEFETRSGDRLFDQFVITAIKKSSPFPSIPRAMGKTHLEIGVRFTPGTIQY